MLAVGQQHQVLQDLALDLPGCLPTLDLLCPLLSYLPHLRRASLDNPPTIPISICDPDQKLKGKIYLLPNSSLASQALIGIFLRSRLCNLDDPAKQLALVHVVYGLFCISGCLELDVAEPSMGLFCGRKLRFW